MTKTKTKGQAFNILKEQMTGLFHSTRSPDNRTTFVFEDDGRVAYAYLTRDKKVVSDLWLYNVEKSPEEPQWRDRSKMPFLNPQGFINFSEMTGPLESAREIEVKWIANENGHYEAAELYIRSVRYGKLKIGKRSAARTSTYDNCIVGCQVSLCRLT